MFQKNAYLELRGTLLNCVATVPCAIAHIFTTIGR